MKKTIILFLLLLLSNMIFSITVDGYAYLENQTTHDNIKVVFDRSVPSSLTDSTYTDSNGYYTINIEIGIYDISYSKENYHHYTKYDEVLYSSTTLMDVTILGSFATINVPSYISTIQEAIDFSWDGDTILVQPGTYVENINFNGKNIILGSLFLTTQDTTYISQTVIYMDCGGCVVTFSNGEDSTAVLTGFTITNDNGGGIFCSYSSPTLCYLYVIGGISSGDGIIFSYSNSHLNNLIISDNNGSGLYSNNSSLILENIIISNNYSNGHGGGIYFSSSNGSFYNVNIFNNTAICGGGGIYFSDSSPSLQNVTINNNHVPADDGGGIFLQVNSTPSLKNVTITGNSAIRGGGIYCNSSYPNLENVTITNNIASDDGGGIYSNSNFNIENSIISNNSGNYGIYFQSNNPTISYSDIWDNETGNFHNCGQWTGILITTNANGDSCDAYFNILLEPCFEDTANGNYRLTENSPCIDAGNPTSPFDPDGTISDMGAYYYDQNRPSADFTANILIGTTPLIIDFSDLSTMGLSGNPIIEWYWDFNNDGNIDSNEQNPQWTYYERGYYTVTLTVFDGYLEDTEIKEDYISLLNFAPIIQNPLIDFSFDEDTSDSSIDLFSIFDDPDLPYGDSLSFTYSGNDSIFVDITNGVVTLTPLPDWFGSENIIFTAFDDSLLSISDDVLVTIINVNDPPTIILPDDFTFAEDSTLVENFAVYIDDVDPDELTLSVAGNTEITVDIAGTIVTFGATPNWNGTETLIFTVDDNQTRATASDSVDVIVTPVNDPPELIGFIPEELEFTVFQDSIVTFNVEVEDIDSDLIYAWFVNNDIQTEISDTFIYQFSVLGEFEIRSEVADEEYQIDTIWDVYVEEQVGTENLIPAVTELRGNYPNPFNPETTINFSLKSDSDVLLQIYNIKGQLIETLINENKHAGYHNIEWNAKDISSGIYLYKLNVNGKTEAVKKCLLLK